MNSQYQWTRGGYEYVLVRPNHAVKRTTILREGLHADLDENGEIIGIEILSAPPKTKPKVRPLRGKK